MAIFLPSIIMSNIYGQLPVESYTSYLLNYYHYLTIDIWSSLCWLPIFWMHTFLYSYIWLYPEHFKKVFHKWIAYYDTPMDFYQYLAIIIKVIQIVSFGLVLIFWQGRATTSETQFNLSMLLILIGQFLNISVFLAIGIKGVYYGFRFGYKIDRCHGFPFNIGLRHPQYLGMILSWHGLFNLYMTSDMINHGVMLLSFLVCSSYKIVTIIEEMYDFDSKEEKKKE